MQHFRHLQRSVTLTLKRPQNIPKNKYPSEKLYLPQTRILMNDSVWPQHYLWRQECGFHTSQRRDVHPLLWVIFKPFLKISAALTGRSVRKWYRRMDKKERRDFWTYMKERWYVLAGAFAALTGGFVVYYQSHIQETPITGRKRFVALTHDQILSISKTQAESVIQSYEDKMYTMDSVQAKRVIDVGIRLLKGNPELQKMSFEKWQVFVVKDPLVNACVLPTGHVFVFDGMLEVAQTQDELAIILGHEMAHALLEHGIEELSYSQFIDYIVIVLMAAIWCIIPNDGIALVTQWFHNKLVHILTHLPHSRELEQEADKVGAMLAAKACYDVRQGVVLWEKMEAAQKMATDDEIPLPTFLSTHPHNLKRAEFFDFIIPQAEKWRAEGKCPLWPRQDPRMAIKTISKIVDDHVVAKKSGQNLARAQLAKPQVAKAAVNADLHICKTVDGTEEGVFNQAESEKDHQFQDVKNKSICENFGIVDEKCKNQCDSKTVEMSVSMADSS